MKSLKIMCILIVLLLTIAGADSTAVKYNTINDAVREMLKNDLREYKALCYADSFKVTYNFYVVDNDTVMLGAPSINIDPGFTPGFLYTKDVWVHKEPTFSEFIEWYLDKQD